VYNLKVIRVFLLLLLTFSQLHSKEFVVYVISHIKEQKTIDRWQPTIDYLNQNIKEHSFKLLPVSPTQIDRVKKLLKEKKIDFIITQPAIYIELQYSSNISRIFTMANSYGMSKFGSVFITHKDSDINSLEDIKDRTVAAVSELAFGGWLIGYNELYDIGIDPLKDEKVTFLGKQDLIVKAIIDKKYDVGIVRSGMIEKLASRGEIDIDKLRVINNIDGYPMKLSTKLYPEWAFAVAPHIDNLSANLVFKALNSIKSDSYPAIKGEYIDWHIPDTYNDVDYLFKKFRIGHYANIPKYTTEQINRFFIAILLLFVTIGVFIFLSTKYRVTKDINRKLAIEIEKKSKELQDKNNLLLIHSREVAIKDIIGMIAHQWRQPISIISMSANNMIVDIELESINENSFKDRSNLILKQTKYLSKTIDDFSSLFKPSKAKETLYIDELLKDSLNMIYASLEQNSIKAEVELEQGISLDIYRLELVNVFMNILNNSKESLMLQDISNRVIKVKLYQKSSTIFIIISDNGIGISKEIKDRIFEPYFTTKSESNGTGLGLYMSKITIEQHLSGKLYTVNENEWTKFIIELNKENING
jgi:signal transduction histidine kinase/ABC-type phosphate/phosphonate transport system substrate-binding protein